MKNKREVVRGDKDGRWGIECDGGIEYDFDFDTYEEARAIADAHERGAETYLEALEMATTP